MFDKLSRMEYSTYISNIFLTSHRELFSYIRLLFCRCTWDHSTYSSCWYRHSSRLHMSYEHMTQHYLAPENASRWRQRSCQLIQEPNVPQSDDRWFRSRIQFSDEQSCAFWSRQWWLCSPLQSRSQRGELGLAAPLRRTSWLHSVSMGTRGTLGVKEYMTRVCWRFSLNPLVTCSSLLRAVSKEPHK